MLGRKSKISAAELLKNSLFSQDFSEAISEFSSSNFVSPFLEFAKLESKEDAKLKAQELLDFIIRISELNTDEASEVVDLLLKNRTELGENILHGLIWDARFSPANQLAVIGVLFNSSTFRHRLLNEKDIKDETPIEFFKQFLDKDFDGFEQIGLLALDHGIHVPDFLHHAMRHKNNDLVAAIYKHPNYEITVDEQVMYLVHREKFKEFYPAFATDELLKKPKIYASFIEFIVEALIKKSAKLNTPDREGHTPIQWAEFYNLTETAKALIAAGADFNAKDKHSRTMLHLAAEFNHNEIVKILIEKGAKVNVKDYWHQTPLHSAACRGNTETVKFLIENGAIPTEELRQLVIHEQKSSKYEKESYVQILELFDEFFTQQKLKLL